MKFSLENAGGTLSKPNTLGGVSLEEPSSSKPWQPWAHGQVVVPWPPATRTPACCPGAGAPGHFLDGHQTVGRTHHHPSHGWMWRWHPAHESTALPGWGPLGSRLPPGSSCSPTQMCCFQVSITAWVNKQFNKWKIKKVKSNSTVLHGVKKNHFTSWGFTWCYFVVHVFKRDLNL